MPPAHGGGRVMATDQTPAGSGLLAIDKAARVPLSQNSQAYAGFGKLSIKW